MEYITLSNGVQMPMLGYGCFLVSPEECERCVSDAIEVGYRSIDTAQAYYNEEGVETAIAQAIAEGKVTREDLFLTTKVWISNAGYDKAKVSIDESLRKLQTDYVDLLLIHQPFGDYYGTWRAMEEAYKTGKVRAIGVSNFYPDRYVDLALFSEIKPMVNQIETHVFQQQKAARPFLDKYGAQIESWRLFAEGEKDISHNPVLTEIRKNMENMRHRLRCVSLCRAA
ncbi:hypothetical protein I4300191C4_12330 [Solibaculum mannosilyticum]|nr:putative oxidoreductase YtbE [Eubacteriaceae bacterium CHKCI005]